ncbi:hypothetical protein ACFLYG_02195 [Chloroflexota bacterium]
MKPGKIGICLMVIVLATGGSGVAYALWSETVEISGTVQIGSVDDLFSWVISNDSGEEEKQGGYNPTDPGDNGLDPSGSQTAGEPCARYDKDVASTTAVVMADPDYITVTISNAYPCYYPTIFYGVENMGTIPMMIQAIQVDENAATPDVLDGIDELTVTVTGIYEGQVIDPGIEVIGDLEIHVEQSAAQNATYTIKVTIVNTIWVPGGGTHGFWKGWDKHYSEAQVIEWLVTIDNASEWLGPTTITGMEALLAAGQGGTMEEKFLAQYLSLRLDVAAGRLDSNDLYDFSSYDPEDYLEMEGQGTLQEMIDAIESKYDTAPTKDQFEAIKDICDALINLWLLPIP